MYLLQQFYINNTNVWSIGCDFLFASLPLAHNVVFGSLGGGGADFSKKYLLWQANKITCGMQI